MAEINDLTIVDASNTARFPENMAPSAVNDGARALEGIVARWNRDINGSKASTGSANAYLFAANQTLSAYYDGLTITFDANFANTGAATLNVDSVSADSIVWPDGTALSSGDIPANAKVTVRHDGTNWQLVTVTNRPLPASSYDTVVGKHTIWVPAAAMKPTVSNGCATITSVETTAGNPDLQVLDFDATADEAAQFQISFPKSWNESTVTFQAFWTVTAAVTTGVAWALQGVAVSDNDTINVAYGTAVVVTDTALNASNDMHVTSESSAVTIAGTPAVGDMCYFRLFRDVSDAADTMTQDARLIGVKIFYTIDAGEDT